MIPLKRCILTFISSCSVILAPVISDANDHPKHTLSYGHIQKASSKVLKTTEHIPDRYIVVFKETSVGPSSIYSTGNLKADVDDLADTLTYRHGGSRDKTWHNAVKGMAAQLTAQQAENLANDPDVALVEEDGVVHANSTQTSAPWGLDRIDQVNLPLSNTYNYTSTGAGITAYIIDTGIHISHQEFAGRAVWGINTVDTTNDDCNGHGTHVAGTVGGSNYGVAKGVNLVAVKVLDCSGSGANSGVIAGIDWVTAQKKLTPSSSINSVANMSLGGGFSSALNNAVANSVMAGVVYAVAAGNSAQDACLSSPSSEPSAMTVGATDSLDQKPTYSNYGGCLDIFAPGSIITSAWNSSNTATNTISGTSMATPHVTGAAALYLASNNITNAADVSIALAASASKNKIPNAGVGSPNKLLYTNFSPPDLLPPTGVVLTIPGIVNSLTGEFDLTGSVTLSATATDNVGVAKVEFYASGKLIGTSTSASNTYALNWNTATLVNGSYSLSVIAYDTSGNATSTSSKPVAVNLSNSATACTSITQLITDPSFELQSPAWVNTNVIWNQGTSVAYNGVWVAWLGGYGSVHVDDLYQDVTIPANPCTASLNFMLKITTNELSRAPANDILAVNVTSSTGTITNLGSYSNKNKSAGYVQKTFNLLPYKGQTIRLQFHEIENASNATNFFIDNVTIN